MSDRKLKRLNRNGSNNIPRFPAINYSYEICLKEG